MRCCACVTINADEVTNQQLRVNQILLNVLDSSYCIALFAFRLLLPSSHAILSLAACNNHTGRRAVNENSREFSQYSEKTLKTFALTALTSIILCFPHLAVEQRHQVVVMQLRQLLQYFDLLAQQVLRFRQVFLCYGFYCNNISGGLKIGKYQNSSYSINAIDENKVCSRTIFILNKKRIRNIFQLVLTS